MVSMARKLRQLERRPVGGGGGSSGSTAWADITGKPSTFPPSTHTHIIGDVTGLQAALDGKQASGNYSLTGHTHLIADVTGLQAALDGKQASGSYAAASHVHSGADITTGTVPAARLGSGTPTGSNFLRGDGTWATPSSGSDPWTYVRLTSDFVTSSATAVDVTGLAFTPVANSRYEFYGRFLLRTATATVGPRPGLAWPTGMTDGVATFYTPSSATATLNTHGNISGAILVAVGGLPTTTGSWQGTLEGLAIAGASPSGTIKVQLASETAGTNVTMIAGSFIAYRSIP